ncbi:MAG: hydrogenase [Candidatus Eisenbacteria bacterium]
MSMWEILRRPLQVGLDPTMPAAEAIAPASRTPDGEVGIMGEALRVEVQRLFAGSLKLRHLDAGSCNGCEQELAALMNPFYDLQRYGIDLVASPRHADGLLLTGPITRHLEEAVRMTDAATPRPRLLIAVGDCACDGGFCADSFAVHRGASTVVPIDVRIPGCPPRPGEIIRALLMAMGRVIVLDSTRGASGG